MLTIKTIIHHYDTMKQISTYPIKIKDHNRIFAASVTLYRMAVGFYIDVILENWDAFSDLSTKASHGLAESLTIVTKNRPTVKYDFSKNFYKFPVYLRRAAISEAFGRVSSYKSNLKNWESSDQRTRGDKPSVPKAGYAYPVLYKGNMYTGDIFSDYKVKIKVFRNNTWDWLTVDLRKSDVDYIRHHCKNMGINCPTLQKRGKQWYLDFSFQEEVKLNETDVKNQIILAVDLGINNTCACSVMRSDGAVLGRKFLKLPKEYDSLKRKIDHIKRAQRHGSRLVHNLWACVNGVNDDIAVKTANFIVNTAVLYNTDVIVMEHLDLQGKKHGSKKQRLAMWRAKYVQNMVTHKAHRNGIHISTICAWGTSRLAYDGSGRVLRGKESTKTSINYSLCEFTSGKVYNCDLNATYNIGARYFIRELTKTLSVTEGQRIRAKVPGYARRSTCTLATLISLYGELYPAGYQSAV